MNESPEIISSDTCQTQCGFIAIVGRPNTGKSTFLNHIMGYHLAAVSKSPQTTRKNLLAILTINRCQLVFTDTPGLHKPKNKLGEFMESSVKQGLKLNDFIICLVDASRKFGDEDKRIADLIASAKISTILVINKIDIADKKTIAKMKQSYQEILGDIPSLEMSALNGSGVEKLMIQIKGLTPKGPFMYDEDTLTLSAEKNIAEDLIRESIFEIFKDEIPHSIEVEIEKWIENEKKIKIGAILYVQRESQKGIVIGNSGNKIKDIICSARMKIHENTGKFIDLKLFAKVHNDWVNSKSFLKNIGYKNDAS